MFVTHDRDDRDIICFIGDSYANCGSGTVDWNGNPIISVAERQFDRDRLSYPVYTDLVADCLDMRPLVLGFGGASWWQTRFISMDFFKKFPEVKSRIKKVVAVHTDSYRNNSTNCNEEAVKSFQVTKWFDPIFNDWCQQRWFQELSNVIFPTADIVNFACFGWGMDTNDTHQLGHVYLRGVVVVDPLILLTVGEFCGSQMQIKKSLAASTDHPGTKNPHHCHLNAKNHAALAEFICDTLGSMHGPRERSIPLHCFNQPNPNARHWPDGRYWTD